MTTFFIGDTHFGHRGIINFTSTKPFRPFQSIEEHDEELVRRWNSVVKANDSVWHLGDVCFGKKNLDIVGRLNGTKRLVMGNHDMYASADYLKYFTRVCGAVEWNGFILTHIPVHPEQMERFRGNIHGHLHTHKVQYPPKRNLSEKFITVDDCRYLNVSCEQVNLTPISEDEVLRRFQS